MEKISIQFNSDISKDSTETRIAFYANIGFFIEVAQMLEFNIRKLLCYESSVKEIEKDGLSKESVTKICGEKDEEYVKTYTDKLTLGQLIGKLEKNASLSSEVIKLIKEINIYRSFIVHKIFPNNIISGNLSKSETVHHYIETKLIPMTNSAIETNKMLIKIIELYRDDLRKYKAQVGLIDSK